MPVQTIPPRIRWAVDLMDVQPADQVLEIGCGPGAGAELICERLQTGKLFAIDRSESGVDRTKRRNARHVESGRLTVRQIDLATLRVPVKRLTKVFAFNVNLFWVRKCTDEVALLHERVVPGGGAVFLFYEANRPDLVPNIVRKASAALTEAGFGVSVVEQKAPAVVGIIGRR
jgi:trans-aconitate methyltransferase